VAGFWPFQHSQLYAEPDRLAKAGLLSERREESGRRRRLYQITPAGRNALRAWLADPSPDRYQIRSLGLLKLYFGGFATPADIEALARAQLEALAADISGIEGIEERLRARGDRPYQLQVARTVRSMEQTAAATWQELVETNGQHAPDSTRSKTNSCETTPTSLRRPAKARQPK
jgi:DNA-binding PadR family transcriptional regulator